MLDALSSYGVRIITLTLEGRLPYNGVSELDDKANNTKIGVTIPPIVLVRADRVIE